MTRIEAVASDLRADVKALQEILIQDPPKKHSIEYREISSKIDAAVYKLERQIALDSSKFI